MTAPSDPIAVTVKDAAALTSLSEWQIRALVNAGEIDSRRLGRRVLVLHASLRAYVDALPVDAAS